MLASGAHVSIGGVEYALDESAGEGYSHDFNHRQPYGGGILGTSQKVSLKEGKILWTWDDWSGGEGNKVYYGDEPTKYNYATALNPRNRGLLMARPTRALHSLSTNKLGAKPLMAAGIGSLFVATGPYESAPTVWAVKFSYTSDGTSWTSQNGGIFSITDEDIQVTAMTGDNDHLYWSMFSDIAGARQVVRFNRGSPLTTSSITYENSLPPHLGLAVFDGALYCWDGVRLDKVDVVSWTGIETVSPQILTDPDGSTLWDDYWGDLIVADNQLYMFITTEGFSKVFEYHLDRGFGEVWTAPTGFSIKTMAYQNGKLYCAGGWGGSVSNTTMHGYGCVYGIDLDTRQAEFVTFTRKQINDQMQLTSASGSYGNQILLGAGGHDGQVFIYDSDALAVSCLDDLTVSNTDAMSWSSNQWEIADVITFGNKRWASTYRKGNTSSGNLQVFSWTNDEPARRQAATSDGNPTGTLYTGTTDMDYPYEGKLFHGVHVAWNVEDSGTTSGLDQNQVIEIKASFDDAAAVTIATIDENTTPSTGIKGRTFVSYLANNKKFYKMSLEIISKTDGTTSVGDKTPVIQTVTTECSLDDYEETWDLALLIKDELPQDAPTGRKLTAPTLRNNIISIVEAKNSVTFLDGARYPGRGDYTTHTVTVENPSDKIQRHAEGVMRVRLRAVSK